MDSYLGTQKQNAAPGRPGTQKEGAIPRKGVAYPRLARVLSSPGLN